MPKTATDNFASSNAQPNFPGRRAIVVGAGGQAFSDSSDLPYVTKQILVTTAFTSLSVIFADDSDSGAVALGALPVGLYPFQIRRVMNTGTAAGVLVAIYG
jgi:hypothetical protein